MRPRMALRDFLASSSAVNRYSQLKYLLLAISGVTVLAAYFVLVCLHSGAWFYYESIRIDRSSVTSASAKNYTRLLEYGSLGLWELCTAHYDESTMRCHPWTEASRPDHFQALVVLVTSVAFLANLAIFPSWAATILSFYNYNNRYAKGIAVLSWILCLLVLLSTGCLLAVLVLIGRSRLYSPGRFVLESTYLSFHTGSGLFNLVAALSVTVVSILLIFVAFVWKKAIDLEAIQAEKDLLAEMSDDNYRPRDWHSIAQRSRQHAEPEGDRLGQPPPYDGLVH